MLIFPGGARRKYLNGAAVVDDVFDRRFLIESLWAVGDTVEIVLIEQDVVNSSWIGEEQTSFF